jgi:RNA polymerase sigma-70 factor, ECF subfamily
MMRNSDHARAVERLEALYRSGFPSYLRVARGIVGDRDLAHDAVQEAFVKAIRSHEQFRGESQFETWLWRIVVNVARDTARQKIRSKPIFDTVEQWMDSADWPELRDAIAALPERQRLAVFLRHFADLNYDQIAAVLQVKRGTVAATLHTAHDTLREQIREVSR